MVYTLQRYIFRELLRIFVLATIGLTLILSLGSVFGMAQQYGAGPRQVLHILLYLMPVTLTFVLPMAALFASALAYGRFANDNELDACRASGISIVTLVYPGLYLAILVAIANLVLSFHVMPYFVHLAERSVKADAKQMLFRGIQRQGYYELPPDKHYHIFAIYADYVDMKTDTLYGIVVAESRPEGTPRIITCESARVQFDLHDRFNSVRLATRNARRIDETMPVVIGDASIKQEFGPLLSDEIKFKKIDDMKRIRRDLMLFDPVAREAYDVYGRLTAELLVRDMRKTLRASPGGLYSLRGPSRTVKFSAADYTLDDRDLTITLSAPVVVEEYDTATGRLLQRLRCDGREAKAVLTLDENAPNRLIRLDLSDARVAETGQSVAYHTVAGLALPESIRQRLEGRPVLETVSLENVSLLLGGPPSGILSGLQKGLAKEIRTTLVNIKAEINSRLVFGIGCIPMILIGIGLGIIKRGGHPLSAFGVSCVPAVVLIVAIASGKNVAESRGVQALSGILMMWAALGFLVLLSAVIYARLLRR